MHSPRHQHPKCSCALLLAPARTLTLVRARDSLTPPTNHPRRAHFGPAAGHVRDSTIWHDGSRRRRAQRASASRVVVVWYCDHTQQLKQGDGWRQCSSACWAFCVVFGLFDVSLGVRLSQRCVVSSWPACQVHNTRLLPRAHGA